MRRGVIIFFDFLILLFFELGQGDFAAGAGRILTELDNSRRNIDRLE